VGSTGFVASSGWWLSSGSSPAWPASCEGREDAERTFLVELDGNEPLRGAEGEPRDQFGVPEALPINHEAEYVSLPLYELFGPIRIGVKPTCR
jgi:hypothetical protein